MAIVEIDYAGRTYQVDLAHYDSNNVHSLNIMRDKVTISDDLLTKQKIFVSWSDIPIWRIVS